MSPRLTQMSHRGVLSAEVPVDPDQTEVIHHLMVIDPDQPYKYPGYTLAWRWEAV